MLCALLAAPAAADAYVIAGGPWPGGTVTYHVVAEHRAAVTAAARAWNRSGVRVRLRPAPRSRARLWITGNRRIGCGGYALVGYEPRLRRSRMILGDCSGRGWPMAQIAVHEFGHVLGLGHETRRCATMNPTFVAGAPGRCRAPGPALYRCRSIERDDLRGARRLYGGRLRPAGPATCPVFGPPGALTGLSAAVVPVEPLTVAVSYRLPAAPRPVVDDWTRDAGQRVQVAAAPGSCPDAPGSGLDAADVVGTPPGRWARPAARRLTVDAPGRHCVAARLVDALGRSGPVATTTVDAPVPVLGVRIIGATDVVAGQPLDVAADATVDGVESYTWDFGDPASPAGAAAGQYPSHVYTQPGTYTITVTARGPYGATATATRTVTVRPAPGG